MEIKPTTKLQRLVTLLRFAVNPMIVKKKHAPNQKAVKSTKVAKRKKDVISMKDAKRQKDAVSMKDVKKLQNNHIN